MTQLKDDDMDQIYTYERTYIRSDGVKVHRRIGKKGNHYFQCTLTNVDGRVEISPWQPATSWTDCDEIFHLLDEIDKCPYLIEGDM